ncbi:hypothetical protein ACLB2K_068078 [Fragaria x ananassa]
MGESNCNWQEDEKIQLCDSWARVTVCPITGKSISLSKLWERVFADYVENWRGPPTNRSPSALQSQFRHLKKMLKDWHNAQLQSRNNIASGCNMMNQMNQAQSIYMKHHPKEFDKWACWEKDDDEVMETPPSSLPRPMGQKRAKEAMRKGKKVQDVASSLAHSIQSMAGSTQASVELVRQRNEEIAAHSKRVMELEEAKEDARIMGKKL